LNYLLENGNDEEFAMNTDASTTISFFDKSHVKYISFSHLFNI
jgi:hypothetical protein